MTTDPFSAMMTAIGGIATIGSTVINSTDASKRQVQLIEFQQALINLNSQAASIQVQNSGLVARNNELEKELARLKDWSAEIANYEEIELSPSGQYAYVEKNRVGKFHSFKKYCSNCFYHGKKTLLIHGSEPGRSHGLSCHI